jgi:hypothetical protein
MIEAWHDHNSSYSSSICHIIMLIARFRRLSKSFHQLLIFFQHTPLSLSYSDEPEWLISSAEQLTELTDWVDWLELNDRIEWLSWIVKLNDRSKTTFFSSRTVYSCFRNRMLSLIADLYEELLCCIVSSRDRSCTPSTRCQYSCFELKC